jgi:hypothetical protein
VVQVREIDGLINNCVQVDVTEGGPVDVGLYQDCVSQKLKVVRVVVEVVRVVVEVVEVVVEEVVEGVEVVEV